MTAPHSPGPFYLQRTGGAGNDAIRDANGQLLAEFNNFFRDLDLERDRRMEADRAVLVSAASLYGLVERAYQAYYANRDPEQLRRALAEWINDAAPIVGSVGHGRVPFWLEWTHRDAVRQANTDLPMCQVCGQHPVRNRSSDQCEQCVAAAAATRVIEGQDRLEQLLPWETPAQVRGRLLRESLQPDHFPHDFVPSGDIDRETSLEICGFRRADGTRCGCAEGSTAHTAYLRHHPGLVESWPDSPYKEAALQTLRGIAQ